MSRAPPGAPTSKHVLGALQIGKKEGDVVSCFILTATLPEPASQSEPPPGVPPVQRLGSLPPAPGAAEIELPGRVWRPISTAHMPEYILPPLFFIPFFRPFVPLGAHPLEALRSLPRPGPCFPLLSYLDSFITSLFLRPGSRRFSREPRSVPFLTYHSRTSRHSFRPRCKLASYHSPLHR